MENSKLRILVADDDDLLRSLAMDILSAKYEVMEALDGQDAWEKVKAYKPHLVVTDLMMPRMHGYELCALLKGPDGIPGIKVIVTSSKSFPADKDLAVKAGADIYIVKPYSPDDLIACADKLLSGSAAPAAVPAAPQAAAVGVVKKTAPADAAAAGLPQPVKVRFWGTRGSCPVAGPSTVRYGGNTSCIEVRSGDLLIIFECGTGIRGLGSSLMKEFAGRPIEGHIFVSHTHWDHLQGFPFFVPLYSPKNAFNIYSVHGAHGSLQSIFSGSMAADYFPIPLAGMAGKLRFIEMTRTADLGTAKVSFCHLNHPGLCIGFRVETQGRTITYLGDHEAFGRLSGDNEMSRRQDADILSFARGSDLLIREAQYTEEEYAQKKGWGHSTFDDVVRFGAASGAKRLVLFHHDPEHTDEMMDGYTDYCRGLAAKAGSNMDCSAAAEGTCIEL